MRMAASWTDALVSTVTGGALMTSPTRTPCSRWRMSARTCGDVEEEDVGLADDADEPSGIVDDGQPGHVMAPHQILGFLDRGVNGDRDRVDGHEIGDSQVVHRGGRIGGHHGGLLSVVRRPAARRLTRATMAAAAVDRDGRSARRIGPFGPTRGS